VPRLRDIHSRRYTNPGPTAAPASERTQAILTLSKTLPEHEITQATLLAPVQNFTPLKDSFAVVHIGGHQYKVTEGDEIMVNTLDAPVRSKILLDKVLLVGTKDQTVIGTPMLTKAKVHAQIEEHSKTEKVIVFKKRGDTKSSRTRSGHRQPYTLLRILDVMVENELNNETSQSVK